MIDYSDFFNSNNERDDFYDRSIHDLRRNIDFLENGYTRNNNTVLEESEQGYYFSVTTVINAFSSNKNHSSMNNSSNENYYDRVIFTQTRYSDMRTLIPKKAIFSIKKEKKCGRRKNNKINEKEAKHNKSSGDNLVQKIKKNFINSLTIYINEKYQKFLNQKNKVKKIVTKLLQKSNPEFAKACNKKENQNLLKLKVGEIFSKNVSQKCKRFSEDHNKKQIELLYKKNEAKEVIEIMNKTVEEMYKKYIDNDIKEFSLQHDLIEIEKKYDNDNEYKNKYQETAKCLIDILKRKGKAKKRKFICKKLKIKK